MTKYEQVELEAQKEPIYWFAVLERARDEGNLKRASEAIEALRAMKIEVRDKRKGGV